MRGIQYRLLVLGDSKKNEYFVYVLVNLDDKRSYVGITTDIKRRLKEHQTAKLSHKNVDFKPVLIEIFSNKKDAQRREIYLKTSKGKFALRAMLKETLKINKPS